jgi:hypothetical protein
VENVNSLWWADVVPKARRLGTGQHLVARGGNAGSSDIPSDRVAAKSSWRLCQFRHLHQLTNHTDVALRDCPIAQSWPNYRSPRDQYLPSEHCQRSHHSLYIDSHPAGRSLGSHYYVNPQQHRARIGRRSGQNGRNCQTCKDYQTRNSSRHNTRRNCGDGDNGPCLELD